MLKVTKYIPIQPRIQSKQTNEIFASKWGFWQTTNLFLNIIEWFCFIPALQLYTQIVEMQMRLLVLVMHFFNGIKGKRSRECHNHKPQPFPDPKRKRKPNLNKHKPNKRTKTLKLALSSPSEVKGLKNTRAKWHTERHTTNRLVE